MSETIVIGAGLIGASTAFALARRGEAVTVIDRAVAPGKGASEANGGMLTPSMADPWNAPGVWLDLLKFYGRPDAPMLLKTRAVPSLAMWGVKFLGAANVSQFERATALNVRLALYSLKVMSDWRQSVNLSYDGAQNGTAKIYRDHAALNAGLAKAEKMRSLGVDFELLSPQALSKRQPALEPIQTSLAGAVYFPNDESGDAYKFVQEVLSVTERLGVRTRWNAAATELIIRKQKVSGVRLASGEFLSADRVVIAAGAHAPSLTNQAGVSLAVKPVKGYSLTFSAKNLAAEERMQFPIVDDDLHAAVTPLGDRLRVAGTAEFCGFDERLDERRIENLRKILRAVLPEQARRLEADELVQWSGFRPMHAYGAPWIGPTPVQGVFVNAGHGHLGWTLAAGSGEALAQTILNEKSEFDLSDYKV